MIQNLRIALFQTDLHWQDRDANLAMLEEKIWSIQEPVDLMVLPEMFTTGFSMNARELAEPMNFTATKWMKQMAAQTGSVITGSVIIKEAGNFYNRLLWVDPEGEVAFYDKRHLFRMAREEAHYDMGTDNRVMNLKGWKILPQICYDLRFPVWSRNRTDENGSCLYDLVFYVASWPASRISAWDILLKARAVENLSYSLGVNRTGEDGTGVKYNGHSAAYDFKGENIAFSPDVEEILLVDLDYDKLHQFREKFPAWRDADQFDLRMNL
jgi:predicted amidohydrolase